jgi:hypothetical protein
MLAYQELELWRSQKDQQAIERASFRMDPLPWPREAGSIKMLPPLSRRQELVDKINRGRSIDLCRQILPRGGIAILDNWRLDVNEVVRELLQVWP